MTINNKTRQITKIEKLLSNFIDWLCKVKNFSFRTWLSAKNLTLFGVNIKFHNKHKRPEWDLKLSEPSEESIVAKYLFTFDKYLDLALSEKKNKFTLNNLPNDHEETLCNFIKFKGLNVTPLVEDSPCCSSKRHLSLIVTIPDDYKK